MIEIEKVVTHMPVLFITYMTVILIVYSVLDVCLDNTYRLQPTEVALRKQLMKQSWKSFITKATIGVYASYRLIDWFDPFADKLLDTEEYQVSFYDES